MNNLGNIIVLVVAILLGFIGFRISQGNINLIHAYHRKNVRKEDEHAYGKAIANGLYVIAASILLSIIIDYIIGDIFAIVLLFLGIIVAVYILHKAQIKYNGKWFS